MNARGGFRSAKGSLGLGLLWGMVALAVALVPPETRAAYGTSAPKAIPSQEPSKAFWDQAVGRVCRPPPEWTRARLDLCPLAREIEGCGALVEACDRVLAEGLGRGLFDGTGDSRSTESRTNSNELRRQRFALLAMGGLFVFAVLGGLGALGRRRVRGGDVPRRGWASWWRRRPLGGSSLGLGALGRRVPEDESFRAGDESLRGGDARQATLYYIEGALRGLGGRGYLQLAPHATYGEYVRSVADARLKAELEGLVREANALRYGHRGATREGAEDVGRRARALVRAAAALPGAALGLFVLLTVGACTRAKEEAAPLLPEGHELAAELLKADGVTVGVLGTELGSLPAPGPLDEGPLVVVDRAVTSLEPAAEEALLRWVKRGGNLLLLNHVAQWPRALEVEPRVTLGVSIHVFGPPEGAQGLDMGHVGDAPVKGHLSRGAALDPPASSEVMATVDEDGAVYGYRQARGMGTVYGLASGDLWTNLGLLRTGNAKALRRLVRWMGVREIRWAKPGDGTLRTSPSRAVGRRAPWGLALVHGVGLVALIVGGYGVRLSRPRVRGEGKGPTLSDHVRAHGAFLSRVGASMYALGVYSRGVEEKLRARFSDAEGSMGALLAARTQASLTECETLWGRACQAREGGNPRGDEKLVMERLGALVDEALGVAGPNVQGPPGEGGRPFGKSAEESQIIEARRWA